MAGDRQGGDSRDQMIGSGISWLARWTARWIILAVGAYLLGLVVQRTWSIVLPVVLALVVATVLQPLAHLLERRVRFPRALAAVTSLVVFLGVLFLAGYLVVPSIADQVVEVATSAAKGLNRVEQLVIESDVGVTSEQVETGIAAAQDRLQSSADTIASGVLVGVAAISSSLVTAVITLVLVFFFLKDGHQFLPWVRRVFGRRVGGHLGEVGGRAWHTLGSFIRTQALVGVIDAVLIGAGLILVGVPLAGALIVLTFFAAFVPIVGAVTVGAVAVLIALVSNGLVAAAIVLVVILAVQQLEGNVLLPWLQGRSLHLHAAVVLLAITLGSTLYGIIGAFLAVPVAAVVADVLRYLGEILRAHDGAGTGQAPEPTTAGDDGTGEGPGPDGRD